MITDLAYFLSGGGKKWHSCLRFYFPPRIFARQNPNETTASINKIHQLALFSKHIQLCHNSSRMAVWKESIVWLHASRRKLAFPCFPRLIAFVQQDETTTLRKNKRERNYSCKVFCYEGAVLFFN